MRNKKLNIKVTSIFVTIIFLVSASAAMVNAYDPTSVHRPYDTQELSDTSEVSIKNHFEPQPSDYIITFDVTFTGLNISEVVVDDEVYHEVTLDDCMMSSEVGCPLVPIKPVDVLLPQKGIIESIDVEGGFGVPYGTGYNLQLANKPGIPGVEYEPDYTIHFDPSITYPTENFEEIGINYFRGYSILTLVLNPVKYIDETGALSFYSDWTVTITLSMTGSVSPMFTGYYRDQFEFDEDLIMYDGVLSTYTSVPDIEPSGFVESGFNYEYVIITSESLKNIQGDYNFQALKDFKESRGVSTRIVTVQDIYENYDGRDHPEDIREFIKDARNIWKTEFILLGGDSTVVPVRDLYVDLNDEGIPNPNYCYIPSDLYYACLDGSYNSDNDSKWGEPTDGLDIPDNPLDDDVDLVADIFVGRASISNAEELSNFVYKTIQYTSTEVTDEYLEDVLQVGELLWIFPPTFGASYMNQLINFCFRNGYFTWGIPSLEYDIDKLYDLHGIWEKEELIDKINNNLHIINHLGHANFDYNMKLEISDIQSLTNDKFCFIYSQGCMAGGFDNPEGYDCIAEHFTVKSSHGAFAGIWNTRYGLGDPGGTDGPSQRFHRYFWYYIYGGDTYNEIGKAHQFSIRKNKYDISENKLLRYCAYEITLFGDPQIKIKIPDEPTDWISPENHYDPEDAWENENNGHDGDLSTKADCETTDFGWIWTPYLELGLNNPINCDKIRFYAWYAPSHCKNIDIDLYYDQAWHNLYQGSFSCWQWVEKSFSQHEISKARVRFEVKRYLLSPVKADLHEFQFFPVYP